MRRQSCAVRADQKAWIPHVSGRIGFDCHDGASARHIEPDPQTGLLRWTGQALQRSQDDAQAYALGRQYGG